MLLSVLLFAQGGALRAEGGALRAEGGALRAEGVRVCHALLDAIDFDNPLLPRETKETLLRLLHS